MHGALCKRFFSPSAFVFFFFGSHACFVGKNFLLGSAITDGGLAILLSAITGLYQMTFAGFFVHLNSIPQVLRWLQWMCPLKYALEALSVNEVNSGLQIEDVLQGVPVDVSASLIMHLVRGLSSLVSIFYHPHPRHHTLNGNHWRF
jgi:ABC-2 type transporter